MNLLAWITSAWKAGTWKTGSWKSGTQQTFTPAPWRVITVKAENRTVIVAKGSKTRFIS